MPKDGLEIGFDVYGTHAELQIKVCRLKKRFRSCVIRYRREGSLGAPACNVMQNPCVASCHSLSKRLFIAHSFSNWYDLCPDFPFITRWCECRHLACASAHAIALAACTRSANMCGLVLLSWIWTSSLNRNSPQRRP